MNFEDFTVVSSRPADDLLTPVEKQLKASLLDILLKHGVEVELWGDYPETAGQVLQYKISLPAGCVQHSGYMGMAVQSFCIQFPDGFKLYGVDQFVKGIGEDRVIFFLPQK